MIGAKAVGGRLTPTENDVTTVGNIQSVLTTNVTIANTVKSISLIIVDYLLPFE